MSSRIFSIALEMPPRSARRVAGGVYFSAVFVSLERRPPLGRFEEDAEEPAAPLPSMREDRDLRLIGEAAIADVGFGELCRVLGADPLATGLADPVSTVADAEASPFCCASACCCLARAAAAADPGGGGILEAADEEEGEEGGSGLLREILVRPLAQAPVIERFMTSRYASDTSSERYVGGIRPLCIDEGNVDDDHEARSLE